MESTKYIFAHPQTKYLSLRKPLDVSVAYDSLRILGFDQELNVSDDFEYMRSIPDLERKVNEKSGIPIIQSIYYEQPINSIKYTDVNILLTSYIHTAEVEVNSSFRSGLQRSQFKGKINLPDLEVIAVKGNAIDVEHALYTIQSIYRSFGWKSIEFDTPIGLNMVETFDSPRFNYLNICEYKDLEKIARRKIEYSPNKLYFNIG